MVPLTKNKVGDGNRKTKFRFENLRAKSCCEGKVILYIVLKYSIK